jgi:predicted acylesterase/phospholipase RssA
MYSSLDPTLTNQTNANKMAQPWLEVNFSDVLKIPFDDYINGKFNSIFDNRQLLNFTNKYFNQEILNSNLKNNIIETIVVTTAELLSSNAHVWYSTNNSNVTLNSERWMSHKLSPITINNALASAAIPGIFRSIELEDEKGRKYWHNDGGIIMNTPISPAIQAGAQDIMVIYLGNPNENPAKEIPSMFKALSSTASSIVYSHLREDITRANTINNLLNKLGRDEFEGYRKVNLLVMRSSDNIDQKTASIIKDKNIFTRWFIPKSLLSLMSSSTLFMDKIYTSILLTLGYQDAKVMHEDLEKFFSA